MFGNLTNKELENKNRSLSSGVVFYGGSDKNGNNIGQRVILSEKSNSWVKFLPSMCYSLLQIWRFEANLSYITGRVTLLLTLVRIGIKPSKF